MSNNPRRQTNISGVQITFAAIIAIGLILAINFSNRIASDRALKDVQNKVVQEIELLKREQASLLQELAFVESDAFVEQWAHSEGKMVRDGEVLVVPVPDAVSSAGATPTQAPIIIVEQADEEPEPWRLWWALFFDGEPPQF